MKNTLILLLPCLLLLSCGPKTSDAVVEPPPIIVPDNPVGAQPEEAPDDKNLWTLKAYGPANTMENVPDDITITMQMDLRNDKVAGKAACNNYFGSLKESDEGYRISGIGSTMMACADDRLNRAEAKFLEMLGKVTGYSFQERQLIMEVAGGRQLVFEK